MKILICDYDNTFCVHYDKLGLKYETSLVKNIKAVDKFRKNNIFVVATGRYFSSINKDLKDNNINYDYLCCNNGADFYDRNNKLLFYKEINKLDLLILKKIVKTYGIKLIYRNTSDKKYLVGISIYFNDYTKYLKMKKILSILMINSRVEFKYPKIKITNKHVDKSKWIKYIINLDKKDIYAVGDDINDYEMLKKYNGFMMPWSVIKLKAKKFPICYNVHELINYILENK